MLVEKAVLSVDRSLFKYIHSLCDPLSMISLKALF